MVREWITRYRVVVQICLFLLGLFLLFLPVVGRFSQEVNLVFFSLATSMLASVLLSFLEFAMGTDIPTMVEQKLNYNRYIFDRGLEMVHIYGEASFFENFENAHSIDIMSVSAHGTCQQYGKRIINAIQKHGCKVRFLLADPENIIWTKKEISDALCPTSDIHYEIDDTERSLRRLVNELKRIKPGPKDGSLELRYYSIVPTSSIMIINGTLVRHTPFLPYQHSNESPTYDFTRMRGGQFFNSYNDTFNRVWDQSRVIFSESWTSKPGQRRNSSGLGRDN